MQRIQKLLQNSEPLKWLFYGDSITHGAFHTLGSRDYVEHFAERVRFELGRVNDIVINTAISGHATRELLDGFDWRVRQFSPQVVFVMIGMNDCSSTNPVTPVQFRENLETLTERLNDINALPVLQTTCPILPGSTPEREPHFEEYMQIVREIAECGDWPLIDHLAFWKENPARHYYWMHDPFHPNAHGHLVFAHTVFREFGNLRRCVRHLPVFCAVISHPDNRSRATPNREYSQRQSRKQKLQQTRIMNPISPEQFQGVWSATPTPFTSDWRVDLESVERLVEHHVRLGVKGLFLAGTCGEGAWMADGERRKLVRHVVQTARGRLGIAVQVSDNSATRILDNIALADEDGADLAVIAPPHFVMNAVPETMRALYLGAIRGSSLPICVYDLGKNRRFSPSLELLAKLYDEPNVVAVKDSSSDEQRMQIALAARQKRPALRLLNGDEFHCVQYLQAGYDGLMLGGAAFHGALAGLIMQAVADGEIERAQVLQERMNRIMFAVYGGESISCWLSGEKKLLMELGVFKSDNNYPNYPLTKDCIAAIKDVVENEADILLP